MRQEPNYPRDDKDTLDSIEFPAPGTVRRGNLRFSHPDLADWTWPYTVVRGAEDGPHVALISGVHPAMGAEILTAAFVVVVIGGLGSFWGVIAAAANASSGEALPSLMRSSSSVLESRNAVNTPSASSASAARRASSMAPLPT